MAAPAAAAPGEVDLLAEAVRTLRAGDAAAALAKIERTQRQFPDGTLAREAALLRAEALLVLDRDPAALQVLDAIVLHADVGDRRASLARGELRASAGRCAEAAGDFTRVLATDARDELAARSLYGRGACALAAGDRESARGDLTQALRLSPTGARSAAIEDALKDLARWKHLAADRHGTRRRNQMNIRIRTLAYWGWIAVTAATVGCQADNRVGLEPDGGAGSNQNGGAGSSGGASSTTPNGSVTQYMALAYTWAPPSHVTVAGLGGVTWFDQVTGAKLRTVNPGDGAALVRDVGDVMAASLLGNLWIFDTNSNLPRRTIKHDSQVLSLELSPNGDIVYSGGTDGKVRRFATTTGAEISPALGPDSTDFVRDLSASADGLYIAAAEKDGVHVWRTADGAPVVQLPAVMGAQAVRFAPSGREIAVTDINGTATYTLPDGTLIRRYVTDGIPSSIAYSADGTKLALPAIDSTVVRVFDTSTGAELITLFDSSPQRQNEDPISHRVVGLSFVERDTHVAAAWGSGRLSKWSVADGTLLWSRFDTDKP